eukprot:403352848
MSYDTTSSVTLGGAGSTNKNQYSSKQFQDKELANEPLLNKSDSSDDHITSLSGNYMDIVKRLMVMLDQYGSYITNLNSNMNKYEGNQSRIRQSLTKEDFMNEQNQRTRSVIEDLLKKIASIVTAIKPILDHLKEVQVAGVSDNQKRMREYSQIKTTFNDLTKKFESHAKRFEEREQSNIKYFRESLMNGASLPKYKDVQQQSSNIQVTPNINGSLNSSNKVNDRYDAKGNFKNIAQGYFDDEESLDPMDMSHNKSNDQQQLVLRDSQKRAQLRERAEIDELGQYLDQRKEQLAKVHKLMGDVNAVAKDLGVEVQVQGKKIEEINVDMESAKENVEGGKEQLEIKKNRTITGNKYLMFLLGGSLGCVLILILIIIIRR